MSRGSGRRPTTATRVRGLFYPATTADSMKRTQFGAGLLAVGLASVAAAAVEFGTELPRLTGVGVGAGTLVALVGLASVVGYGFDPDGDNRLGGVVVVFATVAAFGLLVTGLMHAIE